MEDVTLGTSATSATSAEVEHAIALDTTVHLDFALGAPGRRRRAVGIHPKNMARNLEHLGGLVHSQRDKLKPTQKGCRAISAYAARPA